MTLDESRFTTLADHLLERIGDAVEDAIGDADSDIHAGILTITLPGRGQYVINKHNPNREIWLSSPKSGAHHFTFRDEAWVSTRDSSVLLLPLLKAELGVEV